MSSVLDSASVARTYADRLESFGNRTAVVCEDGERLTYEALAARADAFARDLPAGDALLAIEAVNGLEPLVAYLGALRRRIPVLLLPGDSGQNDRLLSAFSPDARYRRVNGAWTLEQGAAAAKALHPDLALLLPTSGSTGAAKLVKLSHKNLDANAASIVEYLGIQEDDAAVTALPLYYCYGLSVIASHLAKGAKLILTDRSVTEPEFWAFAAREGVTSLAGVPYTFDLLERIGFRDTAPRSMRYLTQAGGRLPPELASAYAQWCAGRGMQMFVMYGQTEATARMAYVPPGRLLTSPGAIGVPIPGGSFEIRSEEGSPVTEVGISGELIYHGPNVMMGYAQSPADLALAPQLTELATGDLARLGEDGFYYIVGRKSRFAKLYGLRISLDEVEAAVRRRGFPAHVTGDDTLVAVAGKNLPADLPEQLARQYGIPVTCFAAVAVDEPPTLPSGKIDYRRILELAKSARTGSETVKRAGIRDAFHRQFPSAKLKGSDSFVSLGGDSLTYVSMSLEIEQALGRLPDGWEEIPLDRYAQLEAQRRAQGPVKASGWGLLDTEILFRSLAIMGVVLRHASLWPIQGGAICLMMLVGYSMARFQRTALAQGEGVRMLSSMLLKIVLPGYVIVLLWFAYRMDWDPWWLTLTWNFHFVPSRFFEPYWFLEALVQCSAIIVAIFSFKAPRRWAMERPWMLGLCSILAFLVLRTVAFAVFHHAWLLNRTPDAVLYLIALGWTIRFSVTPLQKAVVTALAAAICALNLTAPWRLHEFADVTEAIWLFSAVALILWVPKAPMPVWAKNGVEVLGASSFYIYLAQVPVIWIFHYRLHVTNLAVVLAATVLAGVAAQVMAARMRGGGAPGPTPNWRALTRPLGKSAGSGAPL